jgi:hypothetical protein
VKIAARLNDISVLNRSLIFFVLLVCPQYARFFPLRGFNSQVSFNTYTIITEKVQKNSKCSVEVFCGLSLSLYTAYSVDIVQNASTHLTEISSSICISISARLSAIWCGNSCSE